jgi:hypothetical protein
MYNTRVQVMCRLSEPGDAVAQFVRNSVIGFRTVGAAAHSPKRTLLQAQWKFVCKAKGHRALGGFCLGDEMKRIRVVLHGLIAHGKLKNETCRSNT